MIDMLGFKLEMPKREDSVNEKARPIYLDMQVHFDHRPTSRPPFSRNCSLGNNSGRPKGIGCNAALHDRSVWKSTQPDTRLWVGGRERCRECPQGQYD